MIYEWLRLWSYQDFSKDAHARPIQLAASGFYHTGSGDEAKCFSCGITHRNWTEGEDPFVVHRRESPDCKFVNNLKCDNVPISTTGIIADDKFENCLLSIQDHKLEGGPPTAAEDKLEVYPPTTQLICGVPISTKTAFDTVDGIPKTSSPGQERTSNGIQESNTPNATLPLTRATSVSGGATNTSPSTPGGAISQPVHLQTVSGSDLIHVPNVNSGETNPLGIVFERPRYPNYAVLAVRISSFDGWPSYLQQQPEDLAASGCFYVGHGDCVRCFYCGGGLRNWEAGDVPWVEHARWFPKCPYVKQCKGDSFIELVLTKQAEVLGTQTPITQAVEVSTEPPLSSRIPACSSTPVAQTQVVGAYEDPLHTVAAQSVLDMGFSEILVRAAIAQLQNTAGSRTIKATDLMEVVLGMDEHYRELFSGLNVVEPTPSSRDETSHGLTSASSTKAVTSSANAACACTGAPRNPECNTGNERVESKPNTGNSQVALSAEETKSLLEENRELKEKMLCKICLDNSVSILFLPCGHLVCCAECAPAMRKCPICRTYIRGTVRTFVP